MLCVWTVKIFPCTSPSDIQNEMNDVVCQNFQLCPWTRIFGIHKKLHSCSSLCSLIVVAYYCMEYMNAGDIKDILQNRKKKFFQSCLVRRILYFSNLFLNYNCAFLFSSFCYQKKKKNLQKHRSHPIILCFYFLFLFIVLNTRCFVMRVGVGYKMYNFQCFQANKIFLNKCPFSFLLFFN